MVKLPRFGLKVTLLKRKHFCEIGIAPSESELAEPTEDLSFRG